MPRDSNPNHASSSRPTRPQFRYQNSDIPYSGPSGSSLSTTSTEKSTASSDMLDEKSGRERPVLKSSSADRRQRSRSRHFDPQPSEVSRSRAAPHLTDAYGQQPLPTWHPSSSSRSHSHPPPMQLPRALDEDSQCCGVGMSAKLKASIPLIAWVLTSLGFLVAIGFWKEEVFTGLELLSDWIRDEGYQGQAILFFLIFITTFPPMPLYSTLIVLSGYCLGAYQGAVISYFAALSGAIAVFLLSRTYLRSNINTMIAHAPMSVKRAIRAVEKQPKLLFLIRLSPYPYNLMNALLATSRISFSTYTYCTALSLFKVLIHTTIGASIHKFSDYHTKGSSSSSGNKGEEDDSDMGRVWTILGVVLCVALLVYLSWVARKAVDDIEDDDDGFGLPTSRSSRIITPPTSSRHSRHGRGQSSSLMREAEESESLAFLSPAAQDDSRRPSFEVTRATEMMMSESPFRPSIEVTLESAMARARA